MTDHNEPRPVPQFSIITAVDELSPGLCRAFLVNVLNGTLTHDEAKRKLYEHHKGVLAQRGWFIEDEPNHDA